MSANLPAGDLLPENGRVLVIRLSALGDVLFALETVAALHRERPDVAIDFLVEDRFAALLADQPEIAEVLVYPRRRRRRIPGSLLRLRTRRRYDLLLDLHAIQKSVLHVRFARATTKIGPAAPAAREGAAHAYHRAVPMPEPLPHRAEIGHRLLAAIGLSGRPAAPRLAVIAPPAGFLGDVARPLVLLYPGTSAFATFKRWPVDRFVALAERLIARGLGVAIGFGPGERELAAPLLQLPGVLAVDGGALGLRGLTGVLGECDIVVAADTGPLHLAATAGTRCVALFGPKNVQRYGPRGHGGIEHAVLFHDVPCRPCTRRDCVTPQCVLGITVDAVEAAVVRQLAAVAPTGSPREDHG
ncbi:MAG: glycosyltransferase family 9 protein [Planctomycetes bacterium]|nr:glycosyltransferase family 9 protein [Planctomycetota bacterium]